MPPKGMIDRSGQSCNWCLFLMAGPSKINLKGDWTRNRHSHWFSCWIAGRQAGRQRRANSRHCHVQCHSEADRPCWAHQCWQQQERAYTRYYSSGLMSDNTEPESIVSVTHSSSNVTYCRIFRRLVAVMLRRSFVFPPRLLFCSENRTKWCFHTKLKCHYEGRCSPSVSFGFMRCAVQLQEYSGHQGQTETVSCTANERQSTHEVCREVARFRELNPKPTGVHPITRRFVMMYSINFHIPD